MASLRDADLPPIPNGDRSAVRAGLTHWLRRVAPLFALVLFGVAITVVWREIHAYHWSEIRAALQSFSAPSLVAAVVLAVAGYLALGLYDWLGLAYAGEKLAPGRVLLTSFLSYAISNNVGHALLSGGSIRYRFYAGWGVGTTTIVKVVVFCSVTYAVGVVTLLPVAFMMTPAAARAAVGLPTITLYGALAAAGLGLLAWWAFVLYWQRPVVIRGFPFSPPTPALALRQSLVAVADLSLASLVLYLPLSQHAALPYGQFLLLFLLAQLSGLLSLVPGGIGVFEAAFIYLAPASLPSSHLLAALIAYRVLYYFLPLTVAGALLAAYELRLHRVARHPDVRAGVRLLEAAIPQTFSVLLLLGAGVLLLSGATPAIPQRLVWLDRLLPLPLIELSHLVGSMAGVALLLLARAVNQRFDSAWYVSIAILAVGIVASLAKGLDYEEAAFLLCLLLMLVPARKHFNRKSALLSLEFPAHWLLLAGAVVGLSVWLGVFSYRHVEYSDELWWQFSLHGDAPRFLRATVAVAIAICGFVIYRLLTRPAAPRALPDRADLDRADAVVEHSPDISAHLALIGDKRLLWSASGRSFISFDKAPGFWVAMGDPVGDPAEAADLVWAFRELADRHNAAAVFYQVGTEHLPLYLDLGAVAVKIGEEARVPLTGFALAGKKRAGLRQTHNRLQRQGLVFEVIARADVAAILTDIRGVSDRWLGSKRAKEKRFSLGRFDPDYLRRGDVAVVRSGGAIVAFANLWYAGDNEELSLDLMRYDPAAPGGVMEFLTVNLMLWGSARGFRWFNLGMAPLSGMERRPLAPLWHKVGHAIFHMGGEFYNFEGLYEYKNKFDPVWRPRYLIAPSGLLVAPAVLAVTVLISGGVKGVFGK